MRNKEKDEVRMAETRESFLKNAFELFSKKNIDTVSMPDVAKASGYGIATLYRYFKTKPVLVVAVATWKWEQFAEENRNKRRQYNFNAFTALEMFEFYLDCYLDVYKNHQDLLRFNQIFNIYIGSERVEGDTMEPYSAMIGTLAEQFHGIYVKAEKDHTLRTDSTEEEMFLTTMHIMLAVLTRYAIGLVYKPKSGFDPLKELETLKEALVLRYKA